MPADVQTMAYVGETPWHGLGKQVDATISPEEMAKAAGLDWGVSLNPVKYYYRSNLKTADGKFAMFREDTGDVLDIVGRGYVPIQNAQVLQFFKEYVDAGEMTLETAGALNGGRRVWALAKMGASFTLPGDDRVEGYVLLMNPHLYGKGAIGKLTATRVVCSNTLQMALTGGGDSVKLWHVREFDEGMQQEAKEQLGIARERFQTLHADAKLLSETAVSEAMAKKILDDLFDVPDVAEDKDRPRAVRRMLELFGGEGKGAALPSAAGTAWGLLNAVTQYTDWEYGRTQDRRLERAWFGQGATVKRQAAAKLLEFAKTPVAA